jgi:hypothetical protein
VSKFTAPLAVSPVDHRFWVILTDNFSYDVGVEGSGDKITVPYGFTTDFASTPSILWGLMGGPWGRHGNAAVIHDYLYWSRARPRPDADRVFHEGMRIMGVGRIRARMMWSAVRVFGVLAWRKNAKADPSLKIRADYADTVLLVRTPAVAINPKPTSIKSMSDL